VDELASCDIGVSDPICELRVVASRP
jgi:hypothetical protein